MHFLYFVPFILWVLGYPLAYFYLDPIISANPAFEGIGYAISEVLNFLLFWWVVGICGIWWFRK